MLSINVLNGYLELADDAYTFRIPKNSQVAMFPKNGDFEYRFYTNGSVSFSFLYSELGPPPQTEVEILDILTSFLTSPAPNFADSGQVSDLAQWSTIRPKLKAVQIMACSRDMDKDENQLINQLYHQAPIWDNAFTSPSRITVTSDDGNDNIGNQGANTIYIEGLSQTGTVISETIDMGATTTQDFYRINVLRVATSGSLGRNEGNITATHVTTGQPISVIGKYDVVARFGCYTVPADSVMYLTSLSAFAHVKSGGAEEFYEFAVWTRPAGTGDNLRTCVWSAQCREPLFCEIKNVAIPQFSDVLVTCRRLWNGDQWSCSCTINAIQTENA